MILLVASFFVSFTFIFIVLVFPLELAAVISAIPAFFAVISPVSVTATILSSLELQVRFLFVALLGVIVTVNTFVSPLSNFLYLLVFLVLLFL